MIRIKVIALGRLKEKYLREAVEEYLKRISGYARTEVIELEPERLSDQPSEAEIENALRSEADRILKKVDNGSYVIAMCIEGRQLDSREFSRLMEEQANSGTGSFTFIIGSSYGLHDSVKQKADLKFSFSKMTFPHQLFRIMLLEQVYRGFKISEGSKYHK